MIGRALGRWVKFNSVGALGIVVQVFTLGALAGLWGLHYLLATALAVEVAVLHNFVWHELWTWGDRPETGRHGLWERLARFNLSNGIFSILGNLLLMRLLVEGAGAHYLLANLITIAICSGLNFLVSDHFVFGRRRVRRVGSRFCGPPVGPATRN